MRGRYRRRTLLASVGASIVAGCTGVVDTPGSGPEGTETLPTRLWLAETSLSTAERESADPIRFENLSDPERKVVRTALEEGEYTVETEAESPAVESLRDRIEDRTGNGETLTVYLRRDGTYYRVGFAAGDHIVAHPDH